MILDVFRVAAAALALGVNSPAWSCVQLRTDPSHLEIMAGSGACGPAIRVRTRTAPEADEPVYPTGQFRAHQDALYRSGHFRNQTSSTSATAGDAPVSMALATLRAGLIEEVPTDPDLPKVVLGTVVWKLQGGDGTDRFVTATVQAGEVQAELVFRPRLTQRDGAFVIELRVRGAPSGAAVSDAPRVRRTGAREGEPLIGRTRREEGFTLFESSPDPVDHENNVRRLTSGPWLDLLLRNRQPELTLTIEKGSAGNAMLSSIVGQGVPPRPRPQ